MISEVYKSFIKSSVLCIALLVASAKVKADTLNISFTATNAQSLPESIVGNLYISPYYKTYFTLSIDTASGSLNSYNYSPYNYFSAGLNSLGNPDITINNLGSDSLDISLSWDKYFNHNFWYVDNPAEGGQIGVGLWTRHISISPSASSMTDFYYYYGTWNIVDWQLYPVPLPASFWLLGSALTGLGLMSRKRKSLGG